MIAINGEKIAKLRKFTRTFTLTHMIWSLNIIVTIIYKIIITWAPLTPTSRHEIFEYFVAGNGRFFPPAIIKIKFYVYSWKVLREKKSRHSKILYFLFQSIWWRRRGDESARSPDILASKLLIRKCEKWNFISCSNGKNGKFVFVNFFSIAKMLEENSLRQKKLSIKKSSQNDI